MIILNGKELAGKIQAKIKEDVELLKKASITPGLAVILIGNDPASQVYVKKKAEACKEVGIYSVVHEMPENIKEETIINTIKLMNENQNINGILVQLPLPPHINQTKILEAIDPKKDVDGFHPYNVGRLCLDLDSFVPCTPLGVMKIFEEYGIDIKGKDVCVVGASNIVGKPMAALLLNEFATVDICHIYTKDLKEHTKRADIVIVAVGKAGLITQDMVKDEAIVIDIGINRLENGKLAGDVDYDNVASKCSHITPVPGGVGPMTIAMLLSNTIKATKLSSELRA